MLVLETDAVEHFN